MPRYRITVEYDGTAFVGWQRQDNGLGIQQTIEEAITACSGENPKVFTAGRTDAGVHALGQIAHFDLERNFLPNKIRDAINFHIRPHAVTILQAEIVSDKFHARFNALERAYLYRIINRRSPLTLERNRAWWVPVKLDAAAMHDAAQVLIGNHDFSSFRASICQAKSPIKTLDLLTVERFDDEIQIRAQAKSFLHHQVRNFVGSLKYVGEGKWTKDDLKAILETRSRCAAGQTAPPDGLYLTDVGYPPDEPQS